MINLGQPHAQAHAQVDLQRPVHSCHGRGHGINALASVCIALLRFSRSRPCPCGPLQAVELLRTHPRALRMLLDNCEAPHATHIPELVEAVSAFG